MVKYRNTELLNTNIPSEISEFFTVELANYLVIKDGHVICSNIKSDFQILTIENIKDKLGFFKENPFLLDYSNKIYQKNLNNINSGLFIDVPKNFRTRSTLHVFYIQENADLINNTIIRLNENAELSYFEYLYNMTGSKINFVSNSIIEENAILSYAGISNFTEKAEVSIIRNSYVRRYGRSKYSLAEVSDAFTEANTNVFLEEEYANSSVKNVAITANKQVVSIKQLIEHNAPYTEGYIENYGVSNNLSSLMFEGVGKINKKMKQSIARQQNKGIVLGINSRLDANPILLIDEYDVEASHGAAIGKVDEEQLYYLMSRGLTLKNAERLIISGFLSPIMKLLTTDELRNKFIKCVERKTL